MREKELFKLKDSFGTRAVYAASYSEPRIFGTVSQ